MKSSCLKSTMLSVAFFAAFAPVCAVAKQTPAGPQPSEQKKSAGTNRKSEIEEAAQQLESAVKKLNEVVGKAKEAEGYTVKFGDLSLTVSKDNKHYVTLFVCAALVTEMLRKYDEDPAKAAHKVWRNFAQAVGLKKQAPKRAWWCF